MADYSTTMSQSEISSLKETLCAQQNLLQKLYSELEAEREASATAASEALNVILRLQGEKAAVKMEAEQYKRLAEEKMCHAEESFAIIEDVIYQREMEVAALDYQVQAYRYKLLSMGYDPGVGELKFPENLLQRSDSLSGKMSLSRRNSAPVSVKYKKGTTIERDSLSSPITDIVSKIDQEQIGREFTDLPSDSDRKTESSAQGEIWEQIKKLDGRVKEMAGANYTSSRNESKSPSLRSSRLSSNSLNKLSVITNDTHEIKVPTSIYSDDVPASPSVLDVFEVPQVDDSWKSHDKDNKKKAAADKSPEREKTSDLEPIKVSAKDEADWFKKMLQSPRIKKTKSMYGDLGSVDSPASRLRTSVLESQASLNRAARVNEIERVSDSGNRDAKLKLLKEIKEKLDLMHDEIRGGATKKVTSERHRKPSSCVLAETMLHFWL